MVSLSELNNFIQKYLSENKIDEISAVDIAKVLDEKGMLKDSKGRPGLPLRRLLRANRIIGNYQYPNKRWVIRTTKNEIYYTPKEAAEKLTLTVQNIYAMIDKGTITSKPIGNKNLIPESAIEKEMISRNVLDDNSELTKKAIYREIQEIEAEIENIKSRLSTIKNHLKIKEEL